MSIAKLQLTESTKLEFGVSITGASGAPQSRLIIEGKDFAVSYPCTPTNTGVEAHISKLKNVLPAGEYPVRLEIIIENKLYVPFQDTIVLEPDVEIKATQPKIQEPVTESVRVISVGQTAPVNHDRAKVAHAVADTVGYYPSYNETPEMIIEAALQHSTGLSKSKQTTLDQLLKLATDIGINYKRG
jgi:hypothetical protein